MGFFISRLIDIPTSSVLVFDFPSAFLGGMYAYVREKVLLCCSHDFMVVDCNAIYHFQFLMTDIHLAYLPDGTFMI